MNVPSLLQVLLSTAAGAALASGATASAQGERPDGTAAPVAGEESTTSVALEGFVLAPDGSPAEGAVVVSSAGGRAVTDVAGRYRIDVQVPRGARRVQLTATGSAGGKAVASASVAPGKATRPLYVDPLALSAGASCSPSWLPTFGPLPTVVGSVHAMVVYDDGNGPALFLGGFRLAQGPALDDIARWDGSRWSALGSGWGSSDTVQALAVYDDGNGAALYAGGEFTSAGGVPAKRIVRWDGSSWSALGSGMNDRVVALVVHDDGSGPALYAAGSFTSAGGVAVNGLARWNGSTWTALGSGIGGSYPYVSALAVHDDGSGPALYAGGLFTIAGGVTARHIAKWNGTSWSALGSGTNDVVLALVGHDDGSGPALYTAGEFTTAGGVQAKYLARWNGSSWSACGSGLATNPAPYIAELMVHDDGSGPALYAGGGFSIAGGGSNVAKWNGTSWEALGGGPGTSSTVLALATFDAGSGPLLYVGTTDEVAPAWNGSSWVPLSGLNGPISALATHDDGSGTALFAGGYFRSTGSVTASGIARWNGTSWAALGSGPSTNDVRALAVYDDGGGPALYAGGGFFYAGGVTVNKIARWDGAGWSALGSGMDASGNVRALTVFDDGSGPALYAGGGFTTAGGVAASRVAKWNGTTWSALGSGTNALINGLVVYDDGSGPALYAGGGFSIAGGVAASHIARWNGTSWSPLASGIDGGVSEFAVYDGGGGPELWVGGSFTSAGGLPANGLAKWDGTSWSVPALLLGNSVVSALAALDDGSGPALYAGGNFTSMDGVAANHIAKWDGASWQALGNGLSAGVNAPASVAAIAAYDDGDGLALYAGGFFTTAFDSGDSYLAKWGRPADLDPPTLSYPSSVVALDQLGSPPGEIVSFSVTASDCRDPAPSVVCVPPSGSFFPLGTTLVTCTATDAAGNQSTCQFPLTVERKARQR